MIKNQGTASDRCRKQWLTVALDIRLLKNVRKPEHLLPGFWHLRTKAFENQATTVYPKGVKRKLLFEGWGDLLQRLKEKFPEGELEAPISRSDEAEDGSDMMDLVDAETLSSSQLRLQTSLHPAEVEDHWMKFLASPKRRRYFSGCFGTRLERIGTQTGLGCNVYRARSWRKPRS
uniref:Uncharacterized protein n=1 Tax=Podarcis muralis TaxID=64176 RepID=A0A670JHR2_PODMU